MITGNKNKTRLLQFTAVLEKGDPEMNTAFVTFPFDALKEFGTRGQIKVKATFDGYPYAGVLAPMGGRSHCIGVVQKIRRSIGKLAGDLVDVTIEVDGDERIVDVPVALTEALQKEPAILTFFSTLSYTNRKEYVAWIKGAAEDETRSRRLAMTLEKLRAGKKNPSEK